MSATLSVRCTLDAEQLAFELAVLDPAAQHAFWAEALETLDDRDLDTLEQALLQERAFRAEAHALG